MRQIRPRRKYASAAAAPEAGLRRESPPESPAVASHPNPVSEPSVPKSEEHYAVEDPVVLLVQKYVITEDEGEAILRRLRLASEM
ncbi:MAG: hypothetical protein ABR953_13835 [Candidatus Acidiferrales bacterium]|jgi:hypothetical protein